MPPSPASTRPKPTPALHRKLIANRWREVGLTQAQVGESQGRLQDANAAPERVEVSQSQVGTAEAAIQAAEAAVEQAELDLSYTKIFAPEDG